MYRFNVIQLLLATDKHISKLKKAEKVNHLWKIAGIFTLASMIIYGCMGYIGIGSGMLLEETLHFSPDVYESSKFWFIIGKLLSGLLFALFIIFVPAILFKWLTNISVKKLMVMQFTVLFILLLERIVWFLLVVTAGLKWYVSPFSLGIIGSYLTETPWVIVLLGTISIFQIWVIIFQIKFICKFLENEGKVIIWISVILLHLIEWGVVTLLTTAGPYLISGWFG